MLELIAVIVVHTDDVQVLRPAAQFRLDATGQHIPGVKLSLMLVCSRLGQVGSVTRRYDANDGIGLYEAYARGDLADRIDGKDGGTNELALDIIAPTAGIGKHESTVADRP